MSIRIGTSSSQTKSSFNEDRCLSPIGVRTIQRLGAVDKKMFERLRRLIIEAAKTPFGGIGKPELLKGDLKGCWSRRINDEHRLVYKVTDQQIIIVSCKYHYE